MNPKFLDPLFLAIMLSLVLLVACFTYLLMQGLFRLMKRMFGRGDCAREQTADRESSAPPGAEMPAEEPTEPVSPGDLDEWKEAQSWWAEHAAQLLVVLRGKAKVVVVGTGELEYGGATTSWTDRQEYRIDGKATIKSTKMIRFDLEGPSTIIVNEMGTIHGDRGGAIRMEPSGLVFLGGKGKFKLRNCLRVTSSVFADRIEIEASDCGHVNAFSDVVLRADGCKEVVAGDEAKVLSVRCDSVVATGQSTVVAIECRAVLASDRAKVKARRCGRVSRQGEALVEEVAAP